MQSEAFDAISPELALVDAELAARARAQLPDPGRWRPAWREPPAAPERRRLERELLRQLLEERRRRPEVRAPAGEPRRRRVSVDVLVPAAAAAVVLVIMSALLAFDGGLVDSSRPVLLDAPQPAAAQTPPARFRPPSSGRLFAWAPVAAASAYELRLLRRGRLIYRMTTPNTRVIIPTSWVFRGRRYRLVAGRYGWQVRPLLHGNRLGRPLVRATVAVA